MSRQLSLVLPTLLGIALASSGVRAEAERRNPPVKKRTKQTVISLVAKAVPSRPELNEGLYDLADGLFKRGPRTERTLVLTFDDGPHPDSAAPLLDLLKRLDVKATFFVVGGRVKARPDLVRRMIAEGHEVGNHTEDHQRLHELSEAKVAQELSECEADVRAATGRGMSLMRPPGMRFTPAVLAVARAQGYVTVDYNNVAGDYVPNGGLSDLTPEEVAAYGLDPKTIVARVERQFKPGTIILLHDNATTVSAVAEIVARARAQGYRFVTTAEMLASLPDPVRIVANPVEKRGPSRTIVKDGTRGDRSPT